MLSAVSFVTRILIIWVTERTELSFQGYGSSDNRARTTYSGLIELLIKNLWEGTHLLPGFMYDGIAPRAVRPSKRL